MNDAAHRSLFLVALPRSMTSFIYHQVRRALDLREPIWTSDGEILNNDRFALYRGNTFDESEKYLTPSETPGKFGAALEFAEQVVQDHGFAYKDVVNPFVAAAYLRGREHAVLHIDRDPVAVALIMCRVGWFYPGRVARRKKRTIGAVLEGLLRAQRVSASIAPVSVRFDDLLDSEEALRAALQALYPSRPVPPIRYIDGPFTVRRARLLELRQSRGYAELQRLGDEISRELEQDDTAEISPGAGGGAKS